MNAASIAFDDHRFDRRLNLVFAFVVLITVGLLVFAAIAVPSILTSANNTDSVKRGNDISACRAVARSTLDDLTGAVQNDRTEVELLTNVGLEASVKRDPVRLADVIAKSGPARDLLAADTKALSDATDKYVHLIKMSQQNPDGFLATCK
jgi:hypothetical protein